jgi:hypothetical protein
VQQTRVFPNPAALRVIGLVALVWVVSREHLSDGSRPVPAPWLVTTAGAWVCWLISWRRAPSSRVTLVCLAVLAGAGGVVRPGRHRLSGDRGARRVDGL